MKLRLVLAAALSAALAFTVSGAEAAPPVLDGKKKKSLVLKSTSGFQDHDSDNVTVLVDDSEKYDVCPPARCKRLPFVYKPAKGIKGGLMITATWASELSDIDIYLYEVQKDKSGLDVGSCGGFTGTAKSEKIFVDRRGLRSGRTYVLLVDFYRTIGDTVTAKVEINKPNTIKQTVPAAYDGELPGTLFKVNCTL